MPSLRLIRVAAAVLCRNGRCLLTRRPPGSHLAGYWEFPGGKLEPGETPVQALHRELREELDIEVAQVKPLWTIVHEYSERHVELNFIAAQIVQGEPRTLASDALGWFTPSQMPSLPLLPADLVILDRLTAHVGEESGRE